MRSRCWKARLRQPSYVLCDDVLLKDGETIGFTEDEKLPITRSKGEAVEGDSIKIAFMPA